MPKFYVQCGPVRVILLSENAEQAAMAGLDRTLQAHAWIYDDPTLSRQDCRDHLMIEALLHLAPTVLVSERGFDCDDAVRIGVPEIVSDWHELMASVNRLLAAAGLGPRTLAPLGETTSAETTAPRLPR